MGTQYKAGEQGSKQNTNRVVIVGNINSKGIEINEEKEYAKYSIAVSPGKDREPQWYNVIQSTKDEKVLATLKALQEVRSDEKGKGKQVKLSATMNYSKGKAEDGTDKYYNNLNAYYIEQTKDFQLPKATIELTGTISKSLNTKDIEKTNPETGEITNKKFGWLSIKTVEGKEGEITKFYNLSTTNEKNMEFLQQAQEGEQINIKARLRGDGSINIVKDSSISIVKENGQKISNESLSKDKGVDR